METSRYDAHLSHPLALFGHFGYAAKIQSLEPWIGNVIARAFVNEFSKTHLIWNLETTGVLSGTKDLDAPSG